ncbi:MAG: hypothetical protein V1777_02205 [Candidatus Micrarchaeota archaeon]
MARIKRLGNEYRLFFSQSERSQVDALTDREFELAKAKDGVWVLLETENPKNLAPQVAVEKRAVIITPAVAPVLQAKPVLSGSNAKIDEKIFSVLNDKKALQVRVVGKFEKELNEIELKRFNELVRQGIVEQFKLNPSYKKSIYRLNEKKLSVPNEPVKSDASSGWSETDFQKNGFAVLIGDQNAREFSQVFEYDFKAGEIKGLKSFDGSFLAIRKAVYLASQAKIVSFLESQKKAATASEIALATNLSQKLVLVSCEFLKEDGQVFEKTKGQFKLV